MRATHAAILLTVGTVVAVNAASRVLAQAGTSVNDGVFSAAQAMRGAMVYSDNCAVCHDPKLIGGIGPELAGMDFVANWKDKTVGDLFDKIKTTMPASAPGTLTPEQTADVLSFVLSSNQYPGGAADMGTDSAALRMIHMAEPKAGAAPPTAAAATTAAPGGAGAAAAPGGASPLLAGVYSPAQAKRGEIVYTDNCAMCHGPALLGDIGPALSGAMFVSQWKGKTVGDIFDKIQTTMPASAPGTLTPQQTADVLSFILSTNHYPAGAIDLAADAAPLKAVPIADPPQ
jgi:S-disulfanyl-L-cysteine oxidoreductase SoxD